MYSICLIMILVLGSCSKEENIKGENIDFNLNDTLNIAYGNLYNNYENKLSIRIDSVWDSRCPIGVNCIWAGYVKVRFIFTSNDVTTKFSLNTLTSSTNDTIISGYNIELIDLTPYPVYQIPIQQKDYRAKIKITK